MNAAVLMIGIGLYLIFYLGIMLVFGNAFRNTFARITLSKRLYEMRHDKKKSPLVSYFDRLIFTAFGRESKGKVFLAGLLFLVSFCFCFMNIYFRFAVSLVMALLLGGSIVLFLVSRVERGRSKAGLEGLGFVSELYRLYKIENGNMLSALTVLVGSDKDYPFCVKYSYSLVARLQTSGSRNGLKKACGDFAYAIGTVWAKTLSMCIENALAGVDVSEALTDIIDQLKIAKKNLEERKRMNSESVRMTVFLVPALYVLSLLFGGRFLDISPSELLYNQFFTPEGIMFFLVIVILFFFNLIALNFVCDEKTDI